MFSKDKLVFDPSAAAETDNIGAYLRSSDGTLITHTTVSGKEALDVNVANEVDIRDLDSATDSVAAVQSGAWEVSLDAATLAALEQITVDQGTSPWVVSATDLDIRDLSHTQDNVAIAQGGNTMVVNADGSINVNAEIDVVNGSDKVEDTAHASGDTGTYVLAVRQDTLASSTSADGDYASFKVNALGSLYVEVTKQAPASLSSWLVTQNTIDTTAETVVASALSGRRRIVLQNVSNNRTIYFSHAVGVTSGNGLRLSAGQSVELELAEGAAIYAIANATGADLRVAEFAA